jgi:hypothetical protein
MAVRHIAALVGDHYHKSEPMQETLQQTTGRIDMDGAYCKTAGFVGFELTDEMYFVRVDSARTTRLLEIAHPDYGTS